MGKIDILQMAENVVALSKYLSENDISDECVTYCLTAFIRQYIIECFDQEGEKENGGT